MPAVPVSAPLIIHDGEGGLRDLDRHDLFFARFQINACKAAQLSLIHIFQLAQLSQKLHEVCDDVGY